MSDIGRPVALGAFPLPFGFLLLPATPQADEVRRRLLAGHRPTQWPAELRGHEAAFHGDLDAALAAFGGTDPVSRFNALVLAPDGADPDEVRAALGKPLGVLVDLVLFATGQSDAVPAPEGHDGEIAALLLAAQAVQPHTAPAESVLLLRQAIARAAPVSPALAGVLHGALAQACKQAGDPAAAVAALQSGISLLSGTDLNVGRAEQHLELAVTFHELASGNRPDLLTQAVHHYHNALQALPSGEAPEVFAAAHAGLGTAYLTMPMTGASDQLRLGVAVGSLRSALTVYTRQAYPAEWSSAQLNLANALVYAPSTHRAENLAEAAELYEAVLATRDRRRDPVGYARALANQGNALAHLGLFEDALARLAEARVLFEEAQEWEATATVRGLINDMSRQRRAAQAADKAGAANA